MILKQYVGRQKKKYSIRVIPVQSTGFAGNKSIGYKAACNALIKLMQQEVNCKQKGINFLGDFNLVGEMWIIMKYITYKFIWFWWTQRYHSYKKILNSNIKKIRGGMDMRRKDKEITEKNIIEKVINEAEVCRIALSNENAPYIVPMNFGYKDDCVYLHSAREGTKLNIMKVNDNICFEVESQVELVKNENLCKWGAKYYSVIGFGKAVIVDDINEKRKALNIIMEKYTGKASHEYSEESINKIVVIKVALHSLSGKKSGY